MYIIPVFQTYVVRLKGTRHPCTYMYIYTYMIVHVHCICAYHIDSLCRDGTYMSISLNIHVHVHVCSGSELPNAAVIHNVSHILSLMHTCMYATCTYMYMCMYSCMWHDCSSVLTWTALHREPAAFLRCKISHLPLPRGSNICRGESQGGT